MTIEARIAEIERQLAEVKAEMKLEKLADPTADDLKRDDFNRVWNAIKGWDIQRHEGAGYAHTTGTDVMTILNALASDDAAMKPKPTELLELVEKLGYICSVDDFPCTKQFAGTLGLVLIAAKREKRIAEKLYLLIDSVRRFYDGNSRYDLIRARLGELDEECAR